MVSMCWLRSTSGCAVRPFECPARLGLRRRVVAGSKRQVGTAPCHFGAPGVVGHRFGQGVQRGDGVILRVALPLGLEIAFTHGVQSPARRQVVGIDQGERLFRCLEQDIVRIA